jgi:cbb3-type cytochrome oxidase cytochrome c subunit
LALQGLLAQVGQREVLEWVRTVLVQPASVVAQVVALAHSRLQLEDSRALDLLDRQTYYINDITL